MTKRLLNVVFGLVILAFAFGCGEGEKKTSAPKPLPQVSVQFGWLFDAHHLGFLLAKQRGYYEQEGVSVTLAPGGLDASPTKAVATGTAQIGQISGPEQLIGAGRDGLPIVGIAAFHRKSPHALISLAKKPIRQPGDLRGKTIAVAYGDAAELYLRELIEATKIAPKDMNLVPFRFDLTPLVTGQVDAVTGFSSDQPMTLEKQGLPTAVLQYSESGAKGYGYMFITTPQLVSSQAPALQAFLRASRRGWEEAFAKPDEALALLKSVLPNANLEVERKKLVAVQDLMTGTDKKLSTWSMDLEMLRAAAARMDRYGKSGKAVAIETLIDNSLVKGAEAAPPSK